MSIRYISLFSGIGGFELGINRAAKRVGVKADCVFASEIDEHARRIYRARFGVEPAGDITAIDAADIPDHDILAFGFPCQDLSRAGRKSGLSGARSGLFFEAMRVAREKRPRFLFIENVVGLLHNNKGQDFLAFLSEMDDARYDVEWVVLNSKYWTCQSRPRVFIIGHNRAAGERWEPILPVFGESCEDGDVQRKEEGEGSWIPCLTTRYGERWVGETYVVHSLQTRNPNRPSLKYSRGGSGPLLKSDGTTYCPDTDNTQAIQIIGDNANANAKKTDTIEILQQEVWRSAVYEAKTTIRKLTPTEAERLQGFPDGWTASGYEPDRATSIKLRNSYLSSLKRYVTEDEFAEAVWLVDEMADHYVPIPDTQRYKCLGNAVTVPVIEHIATRLLQRGFPSDSPSPKEQTCPSA